MAKKLETNNNLIQSIIMMAESLPEAQIVSGDSEGSGSGTGVDISELNEEQLNANTTAIEEITDTANSLPDYLDTSDADATAADLSTGKTAYVNGEKITGTLVPLDTSDATAEAANILLDKTAYVNGEKVTGTIETASLPTSSMVIPTTMFDANGDPNPEVFSTKLEEQFGGKGLVLEKKYVDKFALMGGVAEIQTVTPTKETQTFQTKLEGYLKKVTVDPIPDQYYDTSDATIIELGSYPGYSINLASGKTAYGSSGKLTGRLETSRLSVLYNGDASESAYMIPIDTINPFGIMQSNTQYFGDAAAADVKTGKTFTSAEGLKLSGTLEVPDLSGVTAQKWYVVEGYSFVDADGNAVEGVLKRNELAISNSDGDGATITGSGTIAGGSIASVHSIHNPNLGDATPDKVLSGSTFSYCTSESLGVNEPGTMPNNGAVAQTINPLSSESVSIAKGYHDGNGTVSLSSELKTKLNEIDGGTGTNVAGAVANLDTSVNTTQANLIEQILAALELKTGGAVQ